MTSVFEQQKTIETWDSDYYHPIAERLYDRAIREMAATMGAKPGDTILDAGCGPGVHSIRLAKAGYRLVAIDVSEAMLASARERCNTSGVSSQVSLSRGNICDLSFPDSSFDYVFSWGVVIHIREIEEALTELCRIVKPGGSLALYVTNRDALDQKLENLVRRVARKPISKTDAPIGSGTTYKMHGEELWVWQINIPELIRKIEKRGFSLSSRRCGEFSELQRRMPSFLRKPMLSFNNIYYRMNGPAGFSVGNLLVFARHA